MWHEEKWVYWCEGDRHEGNERGEDGLADEYIGRGDGVLGDANRIGGRYWTWRWGQVSSYHEGVSNLIQYCSGFSCFCSARFLCLLFLRTLWVNQTTRHSCLKLPSSWHWAWVLFAQLFEALVFFAQCFKASFSFTLRFEAPFNFPLLCGTFSFRVMSWFGLLLPGIPVQ